jgi:hypothetical protein
MSGSVDFNAGWREGQRAMRAWLDGIPRYDIPAEDGGCIIVLDLRDLDREFPKVVRCARDSDWCDGAICRKAPHGNGMFPDCPNADPVTTDERRNHSPEGTP